MQEIRKLIQRKILHDYDIVMQENISEGKIRDYVEEIAQTLPAKDRELLRDAHLRDEIAKSIMEHIVGLGPLKGLLEDPEVTEIMVNGPRKIFVERKGRMELTPLQFDSDTQLVNVIHRIMNPTQRRVDESNPYVDISLSDGSRVNIILPPLSLTGPTITIRKFSQELNVMEDLIKRGSLSQEMADFLIAAVKAKLNIIFSGSTGAGKTTTLNILSGYISDQERIVTIEDTAELRLRQSNVVRLETRAANIEGKGIVTIRDLFINSLRMRPDRIIIGEIRANESLDMLQAISSGHGGTMAIVHGDSPEGVISRIETMIAISLAALPVWVIRKQIASALNIIVHQEQVADGTRKVTRIAEVRGVQDNEIVLQDIFSFRPDDVAEGSKVTGTWVKPSCAPLFINKLKKIDSRFDENCFKGVS